MLYLQNIYSHTHTHVRANLFMYALEIYLSVSAVCNWLPLALIHLPVCLSVRPSVWFWLKRPQLRVTNVNACHSHKFTHFYTYMHIYVRACVCVCRCMHMFFCCMYVSGQQLLFKIVFIVTNRMSSRQPHGQRQHLFATLFHSGKLDAFYMYTYTIGILWWFWWRATRIMQNK